MPLGRHGGHLDGVGGEGSEAGDAVLQGDIGQVVRHPRVGAVVLLPGDAVAWGTPAQSRLCPWPRQPPRAITWLATHAVPCRDPAAGMSPAEQTGPGCILHARGSTALPPPHTGALGPDEGFGGISALGLLTRQDAVLLHGLLPADLQGCVQDVAEAEVPHGARHCPKNPRS